jgi:hypothetical protein
MEISVPNTTLLSQLAELSGVGDLYDGALVHLYKSPVVLSETTELADFVEADFTGYAPSTAITWQAPAYAPDGRPTLVGGMKTFDAAAPFTIANTIYGYYITNGAGTVYLWAREFDTPIGISGALQSIDVVPSYPGFAPAS